MAFLDALKQDALAVLHSTANALHAQLANTLAQAGHAVSEADHVDTLVSAARGAATGFASASAAATTAPNYADAALATFSQSMTAALIQFAQQHLPAKFQGVAETAVTVVADAVASKPTTAELVGDGLKIAEAIVSAEIPAAAPIAAVVEPLIEGLVAQEEPAAPEAPSAAAPVENGPAMNTQGV